MFIRLLLAFVVALPAAQVMAQSASAGEQGVVRSDASSRRARDIRGDLALVNEDLHEERELHGERWMAMRTMRRRSAAAGNQQQVIAIDRLRRRERERHAVSMEELEARQRNLRAELERRRAEEAEEAPGIAGPPKAPARVRVRMRTVAEDDGDQRMSRTQALRRIAEIEEGIEKLEATRRSRIAVIDRETELAVARRDDETQRRLAQEREQLEAAHRRRVAELHEARVAAEAGVEASPTRLTPKALRADVRYLHRAVAEAEEDVQAEVRWHQRRWDTILQEFRRSEDKDLDALDQTLEEERARHAAEVARLERKRDRLRAELTTARERVTAMALPPFGLATAAEIDAMIGKLELELLAEPR